MGGVHLGRDWRRSLVGALVAIGLWALPPVASGAPNDSPPAGLTAAEETAQTPVTLDDGAGSAPVVQAEAAPIVPADGAPATPPARPDDAAAGAPAAEEEPTWRPDQYFFAEGFLITTRYFPEDPASAGPLDPHGLLRAMWAWWAPLPDTAGGLHLAATSLVEASILSRDGDWESFDQNRLCFGLAAWGRRVSVWNQLGRCYSPAKDPYGTNGPDPMVGFASVFWAFRTDNPFRHYGWRTDVNVRSGGHQVRFSGMLAVNDAELTQRGSERIALDRFVGTLVWRLPNACRALGLVNYSFYTSTEDYGAMHAACELWRAWEWGVGATVGGPDNDNGHGLQILNRISRALPNGHVMELVGTGTLSWVRWAGSNGRRYSLGGEGTWRFKNGVGLTAGAFRVWLDQASLAEGARRGETETEAFMNVSWLYE